MAKQKEGVYEKILHYAKQEFLAHGYKDASLRTIAELSHTSTSSIYTRFGDKLGLFRAIVSPVTEYLLNWFQEKHESFRTLPADIQAKEAYSHGERYFSDFIDYVYDHFEEFELLLCGSDGTEYADFISQLVELDVKYNISFADDTSSNAVSAGRLTPELAHMLSNAFYCGAFEVVLHRMTRSQAHAYTEHMRKFFIHGWKYIYEGESENV